MALYPTSIKRCQHIKVNGVQCGSPSLRETTFCYYHIRYHWSELEKIERRQDWYHGFPTLEDANTIQVTLAHVMEQIIDESMDHKTAALLLYALQTATINLKQTSLEPKLPTQVVIDRTCVADRPIGASAWSRIEGREYDDLTEEPVAENKPVLETQLAAPSIENKPLVESRIAPARLEAGTTFNDPATNHQPPKQDPEVSGTLDIHAQIDRANALRKFPPKSITARRSPRIARRSAGAVLV